MKIRKGKILLLDNLAYLLNESNIFDAQLGKNDEFGNIWERELRKVLSLSVRTYNFHDYMKKLR